MRLHEIVNCVNGYKKIRNAIDSCAQGMLLQDVILLIDNTVFAAPKKECGSQKGMRTPKTPAVQAYTSPSRMWKPSILMEE
jgi:hypothetical protein